MSTFCYISDDGAQLERQYPMGKAPSRVRHKGRTYRRDYQTELSGTHSGDIWESYESMAMGCSTDQVAEYNKAAARDGIDARWNDRGACVPKGRAGRNQVMKWLGSKDMDGGYGDYTGGNRPISTQIHDVGIRREGY